MNYILFTTKKLLSTLLLMITAGFSLSAQAIVYTASNEATGNQVIAFDINSNGRLIEIGRFETQGTGTGAPLGNQSALTTDASDRWLFVTNSGDSSLTAFVYSLMGYSLLTVLNQAAIDL